MKKLLALTFIIILLALGWINRSRVLCAYEKSDWMEEASPAQCL